MVAEGFRFYRERAGLSLSEAALRLCVSDRVVERFEEGEAEPDALMLRQMALAYHCTCDELLGIESARELSG